MFWKKGKLPKFIATVELGRLARWLRLLGYDSVYFREGEKKDLIIKSLRENRVILTRDSGMSRYSGTKMIHIKNDLVEDQIAQVLKQMRLKVDKDNIFTRCVICNSNIEKIEKEKVKNRVPPYVFKTQESFLICPGCEKIYWKGTHWKLANNFLKERAKT